MKKHYEVVLSYNRKVYLEEDKKNEIKVLWEKKENRVVEMAGVTFNIKDIKSIHEEKEKDHRPADMHMKEVVKDFENELFRLSQQDPTTKAKREMKNRVLTGWRLSGHKREDPEMMEVYTTLIEFFKTHPKHPYAPIQLWWPIMANRLKKSLYVSRFYEYIMRHEAQVDIYMKKLGIKYCE